jgi:uncharacterized membrane protein YbhN (UPF0104 family)
LESNISFAGFRRDAMRKMVHKYQISKFKRFTSGLLFAVISTIALSFCLIEIYGNTNSHNNVFLFFSIAIISMMLGLVSMFRNDVPKEKI